MTPEQAKALLPIIEAFANGKKIEHKKYGTWQECDFLQFTDEPDNYRIKPEPKLRPWRANEVPLGAIVRQKGFSNDDSSGEIITKRDSMGNTLLINGHGVKIWFSPQDLFEGWVVTFDNGKTWQPCGVQE